jgi:hypothetical protein
MRIRWRAAWWVAVAMVVSAGYASAQFGRGRGDSNMPARYAPAVMPDRNFVVCRLMYTQVRREPSGGGWRTDYPYGEINLTTRLSELTRTPVSRSSERRPNHWVVRATDDELFQCPFVMASDVGTLEFNDEEVARLRTYLLKGGFLWVDDFWGSYAWENWTIELAKILPPPDFAVEDVAMDDPIFNAQFIVTKVPQITNIGFWRGSRGQETSERGPDSEVPHFRAVRDERGRIMVVI